MGEQIAECLLSEKSQRGKKWSVFVLHLDLKTAFTHFCPDIPTKPQPLSSAACPCSTCFSFPSLTCVKLWMMSLSLPTEEKSVTVFDLLVTNGIVNTNACSLMDKITTPKNKWLLWFHLLIIEISIYIVINLVRASRFYFDIIIMVD